MPVAVLLAVAAVLLGLWVGIEQYRVRHHKPH